MLFHQTNTWRDLIREPHLRRIMHLSLIFHTRIRTRWESVAREKKKVSVRITWSEKFWWFSTPARDAFNYNGSTTHLAKIRSFEMCIDFHFFCVEVKPIYFFVAFFSLIYFWFVYARFVSLNTIEASEGKKCTMKIINNENDNDFFSRTNFFLLLSISVDGNSIIWAVTFFPKIDSEHRKCCCFFYSMCKNWNTFRFPICAYELVVTTERLEDKQINALFVVLRFQSKVNIGPFHPTRT